MSERVINLICEITSMMFKEHFEDISSVAQFERNSYDNMCIVYKDGKKNKNDFH